jgi:hypothetical protein
MGAERPGRVSAGEGTVWGLVLKNLMAQLYADSASIR